MVVPLEEKDLSNCPWAIQKRSPISTKVDQAFKSEEQLVIVPWDCRRWMGGWSAKWSRKPHITRAGFRTGAQPAPDGWGRGGTCTSKSPEQPLWKWSLIGFSSVYAGIKEAKGQVWRHFVSWTPFPGPLLVPLVMPSVLLFPISKFHFAKFSLVTPDPNLAGARCLLPCLQVSMEEADVDTRVTSLPRVIAGFHYFPKMACFLSHQSWPCLMLSLGAGSHMCIFLNMSVGWHFFCCLGLSSESCIRI